MVLIAIFSAYIILLLISIFLDPKGKNIISGKTHSIFYLIFFATSKMIIAIFLFIIVAIFKDESLLRITGLRNFSLNWVDVGKGLITAAGFIIINIICQVVLPQLSFLKKSAEGKSQLDIIDLLPNRWLPLIAIFAITSFEAGVLEEIFFRGIMQHNFYQFMTPTLAVIFAAFLFGIAHFYQGIKGVIGTSILGIWCGVSFAITGNILIPIIGHFIGDFGCMMLSGKEIIKQKRK